jgi:hypothetical protein
VVPDEIRWRKDKKGFPVPEMEWLQSQLPRLRALFANGTARCTPYLDPTVVLTALDALEKGVPKSTYSTDLWRWINLELWLRAFFEEPNAPPLPLATARGSSASHKRRVRR